jgi:hypothetical protein
MCFVWQDLSDCARAGCRDEVSWEDRRRSRTRPAGGLAVDDLRGTGHVPADDVIDILGTLHDRQKNGGYDDDIHLAGRGSRLWRAASRDTGRVLYSIRDGVSACDATPCPNFGMRPFDRIDGSPAAWGLSDRSQGYCAGGQVPCARIRFTVAGE